jgi:solute carrier family 25 (mitochondrial carnitine/acylcarnitine transporter), member 20/29
MEYIIGNSIGLSNIIIGYPLDTIKVHFQKSNKMPKINLKLYNGVKYPLYSSLILNTIVFGNYYHINTITENKFLSGFILGGIGSIFINPFEIKKIKNQVNYRNINYNSFSGLRYTFLRESFGYGIYFYVYNEIKSYSNPFFSGGFSGICSWLITYPIDTIRTKTLLNQRIQLKTLYHGISFCLLRSFILDGLTFTIFDKSNNLNNKI